MKKNTKYRLVMATVIAFTYLVSTFVLYQSARYYVISDFNQYSIELENSVFNNVEEEYDAETDTYFFANTKNEIAGNILLNNGKYPTKAVILSGEGEVIEESGSSLLLTDAVRDENGRFHEVYVNIEKYLSDDVMAEFRKYSRDFNEQLNVTALSYTIIDGEIVPVSINVKSYFDGNAEEHTIKLTENEATELYKSGEFSDYYHHIELIFSHELEPSYFREKYHELNKIEYDEQGIIDSYFLETNSKGEFSISMLFYPNEDEIAILCVSSGIKIFPTVINSQVFKGCFATQTIVFAVFFILVMLFANLYFKKQSELDNARTAFTSAAAHELKTPLAVIENQCECYLEGVAPEKNFDYVNSIYKESLRMNKLVASLLQYNRLSSDNKIEKNTASLKSIAINEINKYKSICEAKGITLESRISDKAVINCNEELIALAIDNLISNAVKYGKENTVVTAAVSKEGKSFRLSVFNECRDDESKIDNSVWDILYRKDQARNSSENSTGMGLPVCKKIFELHGYKYGFNCRNNEVEFYFLAK